jgi:hypothetical protein
MLNLEVHIVTTDLQRGNTGFHLFLIRGTVRIAVIYVKYIEMQTRLLKTQF